MELHEPSGNSLSTKNIYFRKRTVTCKLQRSTFLEYYVQDFERSLECLQWPKECPKRFEGRLTHVYCIQGLQFHEVASEAPLQLQKRDKTAILCDGIWVTRNDLVPSGGLAELKIASRSHIFGVPIQIDNWTLFCKLHASLQKVLQLPDQDPMIV
jgi:hypothetical protein